MSQLAIIFANQSGHSIGSIILIVICFLVAATAVLAERYQRDFGPLDTDTVVLLFNIVLTIAAIGALFWFLLSKD